MNNLSLCKRLYILHINNLNDTTQERDLYFFFSFYKKMHSLKICFNLFTNQSLGYGYLNFQNYKDAKFILKKINFYSDDYIFKIPLYLTWKSCNIRTKTSKFAKLFVKNFKPYFYTRFLFQSFLVFGKIVLYKVTSTDTKNTRREFIQFKKHSNSIKILNNSDNFFFKFSGLLTNICTIYKKINDNFTNIYIDNVNFEFSKLIWIKKMFEKIGPVWSIFINKHKKNNITNYIFINFRQLINTKKAISLINNKKNKSSIAIVYRVEKDLKKKTFSNKILFDNKIGVSYFLVRNNFLFINFDKTFFVFFLVYFFFFSEKIINIKLKKKQKNSVKSFCILNSEGQIDLLQTTFRKIIFLKKKKITPSLFLM
ncbi:polyadenylate-binding protein (nucleomorph) [Cryptomonas paramecium]|uniref:Polyadenylate-binding protein n=1 Tax=Cryptomonas paramaecium TaxID=2898 RepID=F2HHY2_9CRYP|nr:polyadenylate-binding protein [Cryptomonas paramecium]AEA38928.1 polyadenylate-binding protein [Cryptomonas paramecium]